MTWTVRSRQVPVARRFGVPLLCVIDGNAGLRRAWKTIRTTDFIERLNGEFHRRVKTQGSLPTEDSALVLLFSLVASGQIELRRLDGFEKMAPMLVAAARGGRAARRQGSGG